MGDVDLKIRGMSCVPASRCCFQKADWNHQDLDLMENNEAFAALFHEMVRLGGGMGVAFAVEH